MHSNSVALHPHQNTPNLLRAGEDNFTHVRTATQLSAMWGSHTCQKTAPNPNRQPCAYNSQNSNNASKLTCTSPPSSAGPTPLSGSSQGQHSMIPGLQKRFPDILGTLACPLTVLLKCWYFKLDPGFRHQMFWTHFTEPKIQQTSSTELSCNCLSFYFFEFCISLYSFHSATRWQYQHMISTETT
jgi:hypothetical protein